MVIYNEAFVLCQIADDATCGGTANRNIRFVEENKNKIIKTISACNKKCLIHRTSLSIRKKICWSHGLKPLLRNLFKFKEAPDHP